MLQNRIKLALSYFTGRMAEYEAIIRMGSENGYKMLSLQQYLLENRPPQCIILRHDIDFSSSATKKMLEIETRYKATASYYFRQSTQDISLMKLISSCGCEVSLHYETLSNWAMVNQISTPEQLATTQWQDVCLDILAEELKEFRALGFPARTVAGHGHPWNYRINAANYFLAYRQGAYEQLDIDLEAYNKEFLAEMEVYTADCDISLNHGWYYGISPQEAIKNNAQRILFLSHPQHWRFSFHRACYYAMKALLSGEKCRTVRFEVD